MLTLARGQVDVWACFYQEIRDKALLNRYRAMMSDAERQKELCFRFVEDQRRYVVTRALLRTVLSRYAALDPAQWSFALNAYGKPEIGNPYGAKQRISFNLSHTDGLIVLGMASGTALGIDMENVRTRRAPVDIADSFFAADEVAALRQLAVEEQNQRFFSYWTLKEAYVKARGMGLSIPLDKFSFHFFHDQGIDISFRSPLTDAPSTWRFLQFCPSPDHLVALCTERGGQISMESEVSIRKAVPLDGEETIVCRVLRQSR
ncbi:4'-phosphopantetheinyl transferase family protein [Caballeronia mineralivorans]|jgi:4'-phosphopantetheinyl transferase|uniref:4'-phosphopantetheinyl transferase family protein n=1 Tax=Caballeronia mineralivorans TaxID=2010198 RepID=UPI0023F3E270|nr:4'-phosphopantetheinyl transferase superfamily protein [Caballeronia mineralivorans]MDB5780986.1 BatI [Caballeronia mineralivorans]MEA3098704.1 4-phosphopantetheinyl transferase [Caballeronia mineralivorans]